MGVRQSPITLPLMVISSFSIGSRQGSPAEGAYVRCGEALDGRSRLVGYRRDHDVAFAGVGLSPDQEDVTCAHACVAHGIAFHAVGEVVPVLEVEASLGKGVLDRLHRGGRSGGDRELRQVHVDTWPWPFLPG